MSTVHCGIVAVPPTAEHPVDEYGVLGEQRYPVLTCGQPARKRMVDRIDAYVPDGGPHRLGFIAGSKTVDPAAWFFRAHFHQDPVWPGSLSACNLDWCRGRGNARAVRAMRAGCATPRCR